MPTYSTLHIAPAPAKEVPAAKVAAEEPKAAAKKAAGIPAADPQPMVPGLAAAHLPRLWHYRVSHPQCLHGPQRRDPAYHRAAGVGQYG